jgi:hypothetical protein
MEAIIDLALIHAVNGALIQTRSNLLVQAELRSELFPPENNQA